MQPAGNRVFFRKSEARKFKSRCLFRQIRSLGPGRGKDVREGRAFGAGDRQFSKSYEKSNGKVGLGSREFE